MKSVNEWIKELITVCVDIYSVDDDSNKQLFLTLQEEYGMFNDNEKDQISQFINSELSVEDSIYIYSCLIYYTNIVKFKEEMFKKMQEGNFDCVTSSMMEVHTRYYGFPISYADRRKFHKKNVMKFEETLKLDYKYTPLKERNKKRVMILTDQILSLYHAPTKMILEIAYAMQEKMGYEIIICACPCNKVMPETLWYKSYAMGTLTEIFNQFIEFKYKEKKFNYFQIGLVPETIQNYNNMFTIIDEWKPSFLLGMGMINPVLDIASKFNTLVAINMNTYFPVSEAQILFKKGDKGLDEIDGYNMDGQNYSIIYDRFPMEISDEINNISIEALGIPNNKFIITVVGNRLDNEVDDAFINVVQKILEHNDNAVIVFIGKLVKGNVLFEDEISKGRIVILGYQSDLVSVFNKMNLYLNPQRGGGGVSSMMALTAGIPVVTLPDCDVAGNVGADFIVNDYEEMIESVNRYIEDEEYYKSQVEKAKEVKNNSDSQSVVDYMNKIIDTIEKLMNDREDV